MTQASAPHDLTRSTLYILWIGILIAGTFWIIQPFVAPLLWAAMTVVSTWPAMLRLQRWLCGSRRLAVVVMTLLLLLLLIIPLTLALGTIFANADRIVDWAKSVQTLTVPPPPTWVANLPFGWKIVDVWQNLAARGVGDLITYAKPYAPKVVGWFIEKAGSAGMLIIQFLLTVIIAAILYSRGETVASGIRRFARRLGGSEGEEVVILAARAVRGVALGVVVTALLQSVLGGVGLAVAGLPAAPLLTAVMLMLCLAQLGPLPVLLPAVAWLFWSGHNFAAIALLIWTIPVGTIDNFVRPVLIKKGANLPLLLVFAGVLGGLASMGIVGIFVGPTILAVSYTMLRSWVGGDVQKAEPQK